MSVSWRVHPSKYFCNAFITQDTSDYLHKAIEHGSTPNGVFGAKIMIYGGYIEDVVDVIQRLPEHKGACVSVAELFARAFPDLRYVWLTRRNKLRQAVSHVRAAQTGVWVRGQQPGHSPTKGPEFDLKAIDGTLRETIMQEAAWQELMSGAGISPVVVVYEDFVASIRETVRTILEFLGLSIGSKLDLSGIETQKQSDDLSDEWVERYLALRQPYYRKLMFWNLGHYLEVSSKVCKRSGGVPSL